MNCRIVLGDWPTLKPDAQAVRYAVFVVEQKVPLELEWDQMDADSLHAVAYADDGSAVATGRLLPDGHIGRMAVRKAMRGHGFGGMVLDTLIREAGKRGMRTVVLNAQTHAEHFYARYGFVREGEEFIEADMPHIMMRRKLAASI